MLLILLNKNLQSVCALLFVCCCFRQADGSDSAVDSKPQENESRKHRNHHCKARGGSLTVTLSWINVLSLSLSLSLLFLKSLTLLNQLIFILLQHADSLISCLSSVSLKLFFMFDVSFVFLCVSSCCSLIPSVKAKHVLAAGLRLLSVQMCLCRDE